MIKSKLRQDGIEKKSSGALLIQRTSVGEMRACDDRCEDGLGACELVHVC